jgi:Ser/Thr protein kinase RdoA (MazF antagonist)
MNEFQTQQLFLETLLPDLSRRNNLNRTDHTIINRGEYYLKQGHAALSGMLQLKDSWPLINNQTGFCHNDPAPGNIIMNKNQPYLIDFEFSNYGHFIKEFAILAQRALQATDWQERTIDILIDSYNKERTLLDAEQELLPYLIYFPRRFWRLCYQRYQERLAWTEKRYQSRLWEITEEEPKRRCFLLKRWPQLTI